jgi:hypothetical protein
MFFVLISSAKLLNVKNDFYYLKFFLKDQKKPQKRNIRSCERSFSIKWAEKSSSYTGSDKYRSAGYGSTLFNSLRFLLEKCNF